MKVTGFVNSSVIAQADAAHYAEDMWAPANINCKPAFRGDQYNMQR